MDADADSSSMESCFLYSPSSGYSSMNTPLSIVSEVPVKMVGCRKRKGLNPCRTLAADDPSFRGATVTMRNVFVDNEWKLLMKAVFTLSPKKKKKYRDFVDSSEEDEFYNPYNTSHLDGPSSMAKSLKDVCPESPQECFVRHKKFGSDLKSHHDSKFLLPTYPNSWPSRHHDTSLSGEKHCASCSVKKTPLWRDAEDGTPLCNACGIRYKKYKLRCGTCWHIPKKDEFYPNCQYCGSHYEYVCPRK